MTIYPPFHYGFFKIILKTFMHAFLNLRYKETVPLPPGPKIFLINHPTVWDAFPLMISLKETLHVLIEDQIWSFFVPRFIFERSNQVRLYTGEGYKKTREDAVQLLGLGKNLLLSPEGGRTPLGTTVRARKYPVVMAMEARIPLIPVGVHIKEEDIRIKPVHYNIDGNKYTDQTLIPRFRAPYGVLVGSPFYLDEYFDSEMTLDTYQNVADTLLSQVYALAEEAKQLFA